MSDYLLTVVSEPESPIRLSQSDFDLIYKAGLDNMNNDSESGKEFAILETVDGSDFIFEGSVIGAAEAAAGFRSGLAYILKEVLSKHKK